MKNNKVVGYGVGLHADGPYNLSCHPPQLFKNSVESPFHGLHGAYRGYFGRAVVQKLCRV